MSRNVKELEEKIGYNFKDSHLLRHAVTHSSYVNEKHMKKADCNERLEFLGDAVLELISSEYLFFENQTMPEGELTKLRASMVCEKALAFCARDLELGSYLLLGKGEDATGGRFRESITSDALEALIGAIYLDGGFANAKEFILKYILNDLEGKRLFYDSKTILQEIVQANFKEVILPCRGCDRRRSLWMWYRKNQKGCRTGSGLSGNPEAERRKGTVGEACI